MKKIIFGLMLIILSGFAIALNTGDTGLGDTGFYDTGDTSYAEFSEEDLSEMIAEDIAENIDYIDDITGLNQYELNKYVETYYGSSISVEDAPPGATLTSEGYLTNGEYGSLINLNNVPTNALVFLGNDGSITIYAKESDGIEIDSNLLLENNRIDGIERSPIEIVATTGNLKFVDGSILHENSKITLIDENTFVIEGTVENNGIEISSKEKKGPVIVLKRDEFNMIDILTEIKATGISNDGRVIFTPETIFLGDDAEVIIRENQDYKVGARQGLIFSSNFNGGILYDISQETPYINIIGNGVVFNGLRLFQRNEAGDFFSFRGGWRKGSEEQYGSEETKQYNEKLKDKYGYLPQSTIDMDIKSYDIYNLGNPEDHYELRSGNLHDKLGTPDLYVSNYFLDDNFDKVEKKKAAIIWSSKLGQDRSDFKNVVETKKRQLIAQGYNEEDIQIIEFTDQESYFAALDKITDATYLEIVSHGAVGSSDGGLILPREYYEADVSKNVRNTYPITSKEMKKYMEGRQKKVNELEAESLFSQEGAICVVSTCHSAASASVYNPEFEGFTTYYPTSEAEPMAQVIAGATNDDVVVYGTIGPLYLVGEQDENGRWSKTFIPVSDSTAVFEGTENPSMETIYSQDIPYYPVTAED